jgi:16S rRNA (cytosine967-C5)-methyltransferase
MEKKLHPNLISSIAEILRDIFEKNFLADRVIEFAFKSHKQWGSRDRKFVAETTYDIVRFWRLMWHIANHEVSFQQKDLEKLIYLYHELKGEKTFMEWYEQKSFKGIAPAIIHSISDELYKKGFDELGETWNKELKAMNKPSDLVIRVNILKAKKYKVIEALKAANILFEDSTTAPDALIIKQKANIYQLEIFKNGWIEVQDINSQMIAPLLDIQDGMRVIDACAGGGGKTLHMAAQMQNKGKIIALDIEQRKLDNLKTRAARSGASNIETRLIEDAKTIKRLENTADRLLLDAPCSGIGVLKRNPDAKYKMNLEKIARIQKIQAEILNDYSTMLKSGGKMIYATCSIFKSENEMQVEQFLKNNSDFTLLKQQTLYTSETGYDGFFISEIMKS